MGAMGKEMESLRAQAAEASDAKKAAKEAIKKCILSSGTIDSLDFKDIEVLPKSNGAPIVTKINKIPYSDLQVSISHEKDYAIAMAMILL